MNNVLFDILTILISLAAFVMAILAIFAENKQSLFDQRMRVYTLFKDLLETYKCYCHLARATAASGQAITLDNRFEWLTNTPIFKDIQDSNNCEDIVIGKKAVCEACTKLLSDAEEVGLLWKRRKRFWFSKEIRDFMRTYALYLTAIMEYKEAETNYNDIVNIVGNESLVIDSACFDDIIQAKVNMAIAEQKASDLDDRLLYMYENRIMKKPPKKDLDGYEEALIAMKDKTRL